MINQENIEKFAKYFSGHTAFHVSNTYPLDVTVKKGAKLKGSVPPHFKQEEVTEDLYERHLKGVEGLGVCPVNEDAKCKFAVLDIDSYSSDYAWLLKLNRDLGLGFLPFRSKSGGLHLYMFFKKATSAKSVIAAFEKFIDAFDLNKRFADKDGNSKVEIFPKQAFIPKGKNGGAVTLPYYGDERALQYLLDDDGEKVDLDDALEIVNQSRSTLDILTTALENIPYSDAPKCVQTILVSGVLGENSGRNNFLFTCAVYLKKKHGRDFAEKLVEYNNNLPVPLEDAEIDAMIAKVEEKDYNYKCKDIPCKNYCNPKECAKREFGVGRDKGHFTGLDYGKIRKLDAQTPYWIWELRVMLSGDDADATEEREFVDVMFPDPSSIIKQSSFADIVMAKLNYVPNAIDPFEWRKLVNKYLEKIEIISVKESEDTSEDAEVKKTFTTYLTTTADLSGTLAFVKIGKPVLHQGKYYFTVDGIMRYLMTKGIRFRRHTFFDKLKDFGAVSTSLEYESGGKKQIIECFSMDRTKELEEREAYYDDVYEADRRAIEASSEDDEVKEESKEEVLEDADSLF